MIIVKHMFKIRNYKKSDYLKVKNILLDADMFDEVWDSEENFSGMIKKDPESIIVAVDGNRIQGQLLIVPYGVTIHYLFRLAVKKEYRRKGIAESLINYAINIAKKRNVIEVGLYVNARNKKLQEYYKKRGFNVSKNQYFYMWREISK